MRWQDLVLSTGVVVFIIALLPSVFSADKPAFSTSLMTGAVLTVFFVTYISLGLLYTAVMVALNAIVWFILAVQVRRKHLRTIAKEDNDAA